MTRQWKDLLPRPVAFALSGGASFGSLQVGMLRALKEAAIEPDMVVGTSVGALNGAVVANHGMQRGVELLDTLWRQLARQDIFPGGLLSQVMCLLRTRLNLFPHDQLGDLICDQLTVHRFEDLTLPFGALATDLLAHRGLFQSGDLKPALLATSALPGIYPPLTIDDIQYVDGGVVANVPLRSALGMGAASIVVLDVGNTCKQFVRPKHIAELLMTTYQVTLRQRVLVEAPEVASQVPVLYLPCPCTVNGSPLDFDQGGELMDLTAEVVMDFLDSAPTPVAGSMSGSPHFHNREFVLGGVTAPAPVTVA